jgi:tetratricopeptide (TPR) repeat protein
MAKALKSERITPADEVRILLSESEKMVVSLRGRGADAKELLEDLDRIAILWPELEAAGMDLRPEEGRWETLQASLRAHGWTLLRELDAAGGLAAVRREEYGDAQAPEWWYLDEELSAQRRKKVSRALITAAGIVGAVLLVYFIFTRLFPADPNIQAAASAIISGQQKALDADLEGALADYQKAASLTPDDPEPLAWVAVLEARLGHSDDNLRSQVFSQIGLNEDAMKEAEAALALDPKSPEAEFALASAYENMGQLDKAVEHMQLASDYADARGKTELTVIARYRLALLLQQFSVTGPLEVTPTP